MKLKRQTWDSMTYQSNGLGSLVTIKACGPLNYKSLSPDFKLYILLHVPLLATKAYFPLSHRKITIKILLKI